MSAFVDVAELTIAADAGAAGSTAIVDRVSFRIPHGEVLALIGESGSGKTTIALALLGHTRRGCSITGGNIRIGDLDIRALSAAALEKIRGTRVAYVAQSAAASFNPAHTLMDQVIESGLIHGIAPRAELESRAVALFRSMSLPDPERIGQRYPHQVSGGQLQRVMAAMALVGDPDLVIFDEPTTALDVTTQIEVLQSFRDVLRQRGTTAVYVSHDLAVVSQVADRIVVLQRGRQCESGSMQQVLQRPQDAYTRSLVAAHRPRSIANAPAQPETGDASAAVATPAPLLRLRGVIAGYGRTAADGTPLDPALHDLDLSLARGATLGVIGESGSGKSTLARVIAGLVPAARGTLEFDGAPLPPALAGRNREQFRRIQLVFQDADTALNPAQSIERILTRPLELYHGQGGATAAAEVNRLLDLVQLPRTLISRYPRELSGGQKQRISLARALAAKPDLLLCDEVTASLDTVVGAAILELLAGLRSELGLSMVFISHDLMTTRAICDELLVMYAGRCVQSGTSVGLREPPFHPYSRLLIESVPQMRQGWLAEVAASAAAAREVQSGRAGASAPNLCPFLPRCPVRIDGRCESTPPPRARHADGREIACHHDLASLALQQETGE